MSGVKFHGGWKIVNSYGQKVTATITCQAPNWRLYLANCVARKGMPR